MSRNDRFGIKPLYYTRVGENMGFASEIKQFTTLPVGKKLKQIQNSYFVLLLVVGSKLQQIRPCLRVFFRYWEVIVEFIILMIIHFKLINVFIRGSIKKLEQNAESASNIFKSIFEDSVRLRLRSDVNVGSCLSGGMDNSAIVTMMDDLLKHNNGKTVQHTISSCFEDKAYDEQEYIDEVLKYTNTKGHKVFPNEDDLFKNIDKMIWHQDEPFGSTSIFAQWTVFDKKKENLKVMLDGQGADRQLAGYSSFFGPLCSESLRSFRWIRLIRQIRDLKAVHNQSYLELTLYYLYNCPGFIKHILRSTLHYKKNPWLKNIAFSFSKIKNKNIKEASLSQISKTSLPSLLHYEDRSSMSHSIEARVPFLDYRLVELIYPG